MDHPVPVDVPRIRYDVLTRDGANWPYAPGGGAGPDQIGVPAGSDYSQWIGFVLAGRSADHLPVGPGGGSDGDAFECDQRDDHLRRAAGQAYIFLAHGEG